VVLQGFCKTLLYSQTLAWEGPVVAGYVIPYLTLGYYRLVYELRNLASSPVLCPDFILQLGGGLGVRLAESRCMS